MKRTITLLISFLIAIPAYAQIAGVSSGSGSCNLGNAENIGQHIIDWLLCGASFTNPQNTLFGALSLVINVAALTIAVYMFIWNSTKWLYFTTQYGVPGGNSGGKIHGGIVVLRTGMLLSLLAPIVGNGFSPIQVAMKSFTEIGKDIGDMGANTTANYVAVQGAIVNADLQNIEAVTAQIIASEMCAKLFDAHHQMDVANGLIPSGTRTVLPIAEIDGSDIKIKWTYNPIQSSFSRFSRDFKNNVDSGICGSITVNTPSQLSNNNETTLDVDSTGPALVVATPSHLQPYADVLSRQYAALRNHIERVSAVLQNSTTDANIAVGLAAAKSRQDNSLVGAIDAAHDNEIAVEQSIENNIPIYINSLKAANTAYLQEIRSIGQGAAATVSLTNNIVSPDCGISSDLDETLDDQNTSIEVCSPGESWQAQLERQGFVALGLYYIVHLKINEKILDLQSHLAEPENKVPFYEDYNNFLVEGVYKEIATSETSEKIYARYVKILNGFMSSVTASTFRMNFTAAENVGGSPIDVENESIGVSIFKTTTDSISIKLTKYITDALVSDSNGGDLILKLMSLGAAFLAVANTLLGFLIAGAAIIGVASIFPLSKYASLVKKGLPNSPSEGSDKDKDSEFSLSKMLFYVFLFLFVFGGLLFFGLPAIPLFKWVLEVQSWAIMMFMAFIYAPLWVMAHASITDDRFMAEHTQSGYGMIYELLLRPLLMVIAFYAMIKLMHIADIGLTMMASYLIGIGTTGFTGFGVVFIIIITLFTAFQLTMRCFDLISLLPDYVISRIGFGTKPLGDVANDGSHRSILMGASRTSIGAVQGATKDIASNMMGGIAGRLGLNAPKSQATDSTPPTKT